VESWNSPAKVDEYLDRIARVEQRLAGESVLCEVLPDAPKSVLDLGCGDGRLVSVVLAARPSVQRVTAVDVSPPMLAAARQRFASDDRVDVAEWDLTRSIEPLGRFDLVVSGFAIHHVDDQQKRTLFAEIARQLNAGGLFANLEVVASPTPELHAAFRRAIGRDADDPEDRLAMVSDQLDWMRAAGLTQVDCIWKWRGFALLVGQSPEEAHTGVDARSVAARP
jgi:SAM-dependent methyltransferase